MQRLTKEKLDLERKLIEQESALLKQQTLEEKGRIEGEWLVTPTGKVNVYITAHDIY